MANLRLVFSLATVASILLSACGGAAAPSTAPAASVAPASSAAAKPASAAPVSAAASAKPAASAAASAKPAASGSASAKPAAAPKPAPTTLPVVAADTAQVTLTKVPIPTIAGKTLSVDIMEIDQEAHLLYTADRTTNGVDIFDVSSFPGKFVKTIPTPKGLTPSTSGPNGLTIAKNVNKVLVGNYPSAETGGNSSVSIIDIDPKSPKVNTVIATLDTGGKKRTDETDYDPNTKKMLAAQSDDQFVTIIDMVKNTIVKKIELPALTPKGGGLEQPRYNPADKMMYLTGSDDNVLYQFDLSKDALVKKFEVVDKCSPAGLAINPTTNMALLNCNTRTQPQHVAIWDFKTAKVVSTTDKVGAGDGAVYNAKADKYFSADSNFFRGGQVGIFNGKDGSFITNVPTAVGSHGIAYDETNNAVYTQDQLPGEAAMFTFKVPTGPGGASAAAKPAASGSAAGKPAAKPSAS